jgi:hypothetical protein
LCVILLLSPARQSAKRRVGIVVLLLSQHAKRCVVVQCVFAMSHCRSAYMEGLAFCIYIRQATGRHCDNQQRTVWRASLATGRQDVSVTTRRCACFTSDKTTIRKGNNDIGYVVAIDNATRKMSQISHHKFMFFYLEDIEIVLF